MDRVTFYTYILFFLAVALGLLVGLFIIFSVILGIIELYHYIEKRRTVNKKSTAENRALNSSLREESAAFVSLIKNM